MEKAEGILMDQIPPEIIINIMEWLNWRELNIISTVSYFPWSRTNFFLTVLRFVK